MNTQAHYSAQGFQLKLTAQIELKACPQCTAKGFILCPQTVAVRTLGFNGVAALQPSTGQPIPCPSCNGKKHIANA